MICFFVEHFNELHKGAYISNDLNFNSASLLHFFRSWLSLINIPIPIIASMLTRHISHRGGVALVFKKIIVLIFCLVINNT